MTQISVVNSNSVRTGTSVTFIGPSVALLVNQGGSWVYELTAVGSQIQLTALDAATATSSGTQAVNGTVDSALISPDGVKIYVTNKGSSPLLSFSFPYRVTVVKTSAIR